MSKRDSFCCLQSFFGDPKNWEHERKREREKEEESERGSEGGADCLLPLPPVVDDGRLNG